MRQIRRILVAVKEPGTRLTPAARKAAQLAQAFGARIELFHALATPVYADAYSLADRSALDFERGLRAHALKQLERMAERLRRQKLEVGAAVEWDFPAYEAIVRRAERIKADLIVADHHAGKRIAPLLLRFADWELLRLSAVPVLLVKNTRPYRRPVVLAAVDPMHTFAKPAKLDREILSAAATISEGLRGTLHAVHAYVPIPLGALPAETLSSDITTRLEARAADEARAAFSRALDSARIPERRRHLVGRHPADAIPDTARETGSAIVVMGAISRSGLKRMFIGNTAERVLDKLACDVLVVKPPQFTSRVPRARRGVRFVAAPLVQNAYLFP